MTWTYSGDPSTSDVDEVRFYIQDTDTADQLLSDEEIQFTIDSYAESRASVLWAASVCADILAGRYAKEAGSISADGVSVAGLADLQQKYRDLATSLREQYKTKVGAAGSPSAGGTIFDESFDSSIKPLSFSKGMHDSNRAGAQDYGGVAVPLPEYPEEALP